MHIKQAYQMEEIAENVKNSNHPRTLAANLKKLRLNHYNEYKTLNKKIELYPENLFDGTLMCRVCDITASVL